MDDIVSSLSFLNVPHTSEYLVVIEKNGPNLHINKEKWVWRSWCGSVDGQIRWSEKPILFD